MPMRLALQLLELLAQPAAEIAVGVQDRLVEHAPGGPGLARDGQICNQPGIQHGQHSEVAVCHLRVPGATLKKAFHHLLQLVLHIVQAFLKAPVEGAAGAQREIGIIQGIADRLAYDRGQALAALGCDVLQVGQHGLGDLDGDLLRQVSIRAGHVSSSSLVQASPCPAGAQKPMGMRLSSVLPGASRYSLGQNAPWAWGAGALPLQAFGLVTPPHARTRSLARGGVTPCDTLTIRQCGCNAPLRPLALVAIARMSLPIVSYLGLC
jgi:hypothetical protein